VKLRWSASELASESLCEMSVTGKTEVKCKHGKIGAAIRQVFDGAA
jgi:hypothetical protein